MVALQPLLASLLDSLPPSPIEKEKLDEVVAHTLHESRDKSSPENRKVQWEYLLKHDVFLLAVCFVIVKRPDILNFNKQNCRLLKGLR